MNPSLFPKIPVKRTPEEMESLFQSMMNVGLTAEIHYRISEREGMNHNIEIGDLAKQEAAEFAHNYLSK